MSVIAAKMQSLSKVLFIAYKYKNTKLRVRFVTLRERV